MKRNRIICLIMILLMLLPIVVSCDNGTENTSNTNSNTEITDPLALTVVINDSEYKVSNWVGEYVSGKAYIFDRFYVTQGKSSITIEEEFENYKAIVVRSNKTSNGFEHEITEISDTVKSVKIPTIGFVLALPNEMLGNVEIKAGMLLELTGGESILNYYERTDRARLYPTNAKNIASRQVSIVDPTQELTTDKIYFMSENYSSESKTLPENSTVVTLEKQSGNSYIIKTVIT